MASVPDTVLFPVLIALRNLFLIPLRVALFAIFDQEGLTKGIPRMVSEMLFDILLQVKKCKSYSRLRYLQGNGYGCGDSSSVVFEGSPSTS